MTRESAKIVTPASVAEAMEKMKREIARVIVGQTAVIEEILVGLFSQGHILLVGVPGLAKTLLIKTIAGILDLKFSRIQFTPDLMPADITGTEILQDTDGAGRGFRFIPGPVFGNVVLADEINRTPPKTQAALLQAMQEYHVTSGGNTYPLELPFFVLATQNPIEQEGTYPLPEAQLDRFMLNVNIAYPSAAEEVEIVKSGASPAEPELHPVLDRGKILDMQKMVRMVPAADYVIQHAVTLVKNTRPAGEDAPDFVKKWVSWGAGPRAAQHLVLGAKARALMRGANSVSVDDVRALLLPALRHRVIPNFAAEAEGVKPDDLVRRLLDEFPPLKGALAR
ncbi:MAG: MoxR family ATPase [bacterium]